MYVDLKHYFVNLVVVVFDGNGCAQNWGGIIRASPILCKGFEYPLDYSKP